MNFAAMLTKELRELARSYKLMFIPVVYAILGVSQPVAIKMMPTLLKSASNLPPGTVIDIPVPPPGAVVAGAISQFNQMGILLLVLAAMGAIAGERNSGVAATVLTKPVGRGTYLAAKAVSYSLLAAVSLALGMGGATYYTWVLIAPVDWGAVGQATLLYLPNLILAVATTLFFSAFLPSPVAAGGAGLATLIILNTVPRYLGPFLAGVHPGALTAQATAALAAAGPVAAARPLAGVILLTAALLVAGWAVLERQEI